MIKRMSKVTSLILAAAAVISLAPISGVSAAERIETKDGTIESAIAFNEGKYLFEGYKTESDANGIYYNAGNVDKLLEDINATSMERYGDKYLKVMDGSDEYLVDLSSGKVLDETTEDIEDSVKTKLKSALSKTDRYGKINSTTDITLTKISQDQFGEIWYEYTATGLAGTHKGYVNEAGKYIDTDVTANISVANETKVVKVSEFNKENKDNKITVNFVSAQTIAQDKDNIYRLVNVNVVNGNVTTTSPAVAAKVTVNFPADLSGLTADTSNFSVLGKTYNYVTTVTDATTQFSTLDQLKALVTTEAAAKVDYTYADGVFTAKTAGAVAQATIDGLFGTTNVTVDLGANEGAPTATTTPKAYIQKISKAQGVEEDDAYLPNVVASYEVTKAFASDDADDAEETLANLTGASIRVVNGKIYVTKNNTADTKVTVTTINLKKDKVTLDDKTTKLDVYLAEQDVNKDQDIAGADAVSIDVDGNTWALYKGEILKFDGTEFKSLYNVDRAMDTLEVYNKDSVMAWEADEDVYAVLNNNDVYGNGGDGGNTETPAQKGWVKAATGWTFYNNDGSQAKGQWVQDGGVWYMIKGDGIMATGWYNDNGTWYYLQGSGAMKTGWLNDNGTWYYLQGSGAMKTGWLNDNGTWYYLNGSGAMLANTIVDGYKLGASGAWVK
jgi:glucan-binding YG repeat protein